MPYLLFCPLFFQSTSRMIGSSSYSGSRRGSDDSSDADRETSREMKVNSVKVL